MEKSPLENIIPYEKWKELSLVEKLEYSHYYRGKYGKEQGENLLDYYERCWYNDPN